MWKELKDPIHGDADDDDDDDDDVGLLSWVLPSEYTESLKSAEILIIIMKWQMTSTKNFYFHLTSGQNFVPS